MTIKGIFECAFNIQKIHLKKKKNLFDKNN